jgi:FtsZ-interacting cell division protein ZipA
MEQPDMVDILIKVGIIVCFVIFAICLWVIRKERDKKRKTQEQQSAPPRRPNVQN